MILELRDGLHAVAPGVVPKNCALSVVRVHSTRLLYLVFSENQAFPVCAVQFGTESELRALHGSLHALHASLPDTVPDSLACTAWRGDLWILVQSGLPGAPWFSLARRVRRLDDWLRLRTRALGTLHRFQTVVGAEPRWRGTVNAAAELRRQVETSRRNGYALSAATISRAAECARRLEASGCGRYPWQHGDYCFNNLLISPDRLRLIDFEEFGGTAVPLHDELSLAFSADDFMRGLPGAPPLRAQISACLEACDPALASGPALEGLLFHHLLWRLNQCAARPRRADLADALQRHLFSLSAEPTHYLEWR